NERGKQRDLLVAIGVGRGDDPRNASESPRELGAELLARAVRELVPEVDDQWRPAPAGRLVHQAPEELLVLGIEGLGTLRVAGAVDDALDCGVRLEEVDRLLEARGAILREETVEPLEVLDPHPGQLDRRHVVAAHVREVRANAAPEGLLAEI